MFGSDSTFAGIGNDSEVATAPPPPPPPAEEAGRGRGGGIASRGGRGGGIAARGGSGVATPGGRGAKGRDLPPAPASKGNNSASASSSFLRPALVPAPIPVNMQLRKVGSNPDQNASADANTPSFKKSPSPASQAPEEISLSDLRGKVGNLKERFMGKASLERTNEAVEVIPQKSVAPDMEDFAAEEIVSFEQLKSLVLSERRERMAMLKELKDIEARLGRLEGVYTGSA